MEKQAKSVHLFNCDKMFDLDLVESLFTAMASKLEIDFSIKKHYFNLREMAEMSNNTVPGLKMDFAVFVVHAHESRLSINEDNAGIGYAMIYRALVKATDDNVIIVIGGDDQYKDEDEEERVVISRWARRKVSSQFNEEYLDGRKSFIFSWNKQHRPIHEEALLHYFDPTKKGQKFEPKPKPKPKPEVEIVNEVENEPNDDSPNAAPLGGTGGADVSTPQAEVPQPKPTNQVAQPNQATSLLRRIWNRCTIL